jgi:membrane protein DedA with SNARE-associated domain
LNFLISSPGYAVLGLFVLLGALGAPLPLTVALSGAGALARQGQLNLVLLFTICAAAAVAGDCLGYSAGRLGIRRLPKPAWAAPWLRRLEQSIPTDTRRHGRMGMLIFITRWALTLPAPLVNLVAGARRYPLRAFLFVDTAGEAVWCVMALMPGYLLGENKAIGLPLSIAAGLLLGAIGLLLSRRFSLARVMRHMEVTTDAPDRRKSAGSSAHEATVGSLRTTSAGPGDGQAKRRRLGGLRASQIARFNRAADTAQETDRNEARSA